MTLLADQGFIYFAVGLAFAALIMLAIATNRDQGGG